MDTGPIVAQQQTAVDPRENAAELTERLFEMGAALLTEILPSWAAGEVQARRQDDSAATVTKRLSKADGDIDWKLPADRIARQVRAYQPWPGSFTRWNGQVVKIIEAESTKVGSIDSASPGHVLAMTDGRIGVVTGEGVLELQRLQLEGKRAVSAAEFMQGYTELVGATLGR
jgi:methionyl-tRNA formyltransferase